MDELIVLPALGDYGELTTHFPVLIEELKASAHRGNALAHLVIAKLLEEEGTGSGDDDARFGRELATTGVWATPHLAFDAIGGGPGEIVAKHRHHLLAAARAGDIRGGSGDRRAFSEPGPPGVTDREGVDTSSMVQLARVTGRYEQARHWLKVAARSGDVGAMAELIEEHDLPLQEG